MSDLELYHFGVPGMKWGVRKKRQTTTASKVEAKKKKMDATAARLAAAKSVKKSARKEWNDSFNELRSITKNWGPSGKSVHARAEKTADKSVKADKAYKDAKKAYKAAKKDYKKESKLDNAKYAKESSGKKVMDWVASGSGGRKQINKMLNKHPNLTVAQARKTTYIESGLNTTAMLLAAYGGYKLSTIKR